MDETLLQAYRDTEYLVCLDTVEWACIRVDQALPASLRRMVDVSAWGFITAWNPLSEARALADNLAAQRALRADLQIIPDASMFAAIGIGRGGWHEPSLFVIGADQPSLDVLGRRYRQHAYVHGTGAEPARLRILSN
ncbi:MULTISPECIES: DUF3293 domain-containing protein [unclassified Rhodanobacter]|uniref:DUF3293 domain-containing protein n=1 Tax=unclassified Rhodanobacter TaxID=2621553 RepID=UPI0015C814B9|nr:MULTISPECIES: DUF3293 domain-containing protein [unclassified Rhodanobacter]